MTWLFAEVIIDIPHGEIDQIYDYCIPPELEEKAIEGSQVVVPFGRTERTGFILRTKKETEVTGLKEIKRVLQPGLLSTVQLKLVDWLRQNYFCFYVSAINAVIPTEIAREDVKKTSRVYLQGKKDVTHWGKAYKQKKVWEFLNRNSGPIDLDVLMERVGASRSTIKELEKKGIVKISREIKGKDPLESRPKNRKKVDQVLQSDKLVKMLNNKEKVVYSYAAQESNFNLYVNLISRFLERGKNVILLYPEAYMAEREAKKFLEFFPEELALFHSDLKGLERYHQWWEIKKGKKKIVIGTRSAVFAPLSDLGLIIIHDEENENYKQIEHPRYQTSEIASFRTSLEEGGLLLVSTAPAAETYYNIQKGSYRWSKGFKTGKTRFPVELIDMREEFGQGNISILSLRAQEQIKKTQEENKQTLLFINRRGYASFVLCRTCGKSLLCPKCNIALTYHKGQRKLKCRQCSFEQKTEKACPDCGGKYIRPLGIGVERVSEEVEKLYPDLKFCVVDSDVIKSRENLEEIARKIERGYFDLVIGTQLIFKDIFPRFDLGLMLLADIHLNLPFYTSQEETWNLIDGCLKRLRRGRMLIQTYDPENPTLKFARERNYKDFIERELEYRNHFNYPPFFQYLLLILSGKNEKEVAKAGRYLASNIAPLAQKGVVEMLGPAAINGTGKEVRYQVTCRSKNRENLRETVEKVRETIKRLIGHGIEVQLELNPKRML